MRTLLAALLLTAVAFAADTRDLGPATPSEMRSERRAALVIGNGAYASGALRNPPNDARAVASALEDLGFEVTLVTDVDQAGMKTAIIDFGLALEAGGVGLFYYAGHGIQHQGRNYLVPLGARISDEAYIDVMAVDVNLVLAGMDAAHNRLNIVILDACRNNPFASRFRSQRQGLAQLNAPTGTFIAFATGPGDVAEDGTGAHSSFTQALVRRLDSQGLELEKVFKAVRQDVYQATGGSQTPWTNSSVMGDFYFAMPDGADTAVAPEPTVQPAATPEPTVQPAATPEPPPREEASPAVLEPSTGAAHHESHLDLARLCLARSSQTRGFLVPITVWGGNLELTSLGVGDRRCVEVEPGEIWLQAAYAKRANRRNLTLQLEPGQVRYLELRAGDGAPNFADLTEAEFEAED